MHLSHLALSDFRNFRDAVVEFSPGVMVLVGQNGQGKTNLVEAIAYLSTFSSHRVSADTALVRAGTPGAVVRAKVVSGGGTKGRAQTLELEIIAGRANRARLNRGQVRPRDLLGILRTVVFAPEDLALVKGDPSDRRRLLDELMILRTPRLAAVKAEYEKILRQRSALLKQAGGRARGGRAGGGRAGGGRPDEYAESTLDVWDAQLASAGAQISVARAQLVADLAPHVAAAYRLVSESDRLATVELQSSLEREEARLLGVQRSPSLAEGTSPGVEGTLPGVEGTLPGVEGTLPGVEGTLPGAGSDDAGRATTPGPVPQMAEVEERLRAVMRELRPAELERGVTLVGPHRDDLFLALGELPAKGYASHGESWSLALALRIAEFELLRQDDPDTPILILDDVFAELDSARRRQLVRLVGEAEQVFVTAAVAEDLPQDLSGRRYRVVAGTITHENGPQEHAAEAGTSGTNSADDAGGDEEDPDE